MLSSNLYLSRPEIALVEYTRIESDARPQPIFALSFLDLSRLIAFFISVFAWLTEIKMQVDSAWYDRGVAVGRLLSLSLAPSQERSISGQTEGRDSHPRG